MSASATESSPITLPDDPGSAHAYRLLNALGITTHEYASKSDALGCWANSGAMWLTGSTQPQAIQAPLAASARGALLALKKLSPELANRFPGDFPAECLLGERAAITGFERRGARNCGDSSQLMHTRDGVIALNLPRPDDWEQLPALLSRGPACDLPVPGDWIQLQRCIAQQVSADLVELGQLLGVAVADAKTPAKQNQWLRRSYHSEVPAPQAHSPLVVDLSALWAGPLCGSLLVMSGARVIKVESRNRPDGARQGPRPFFDLLNAGKSSLALDLPSQSDMLRQLIKRADIVIESSRPRALQQLGIDAQSLLLEKPGLVWVSITGYGRDNELAVAYGDDAGVAAGLSKTLFDLTGEWLFCGDAIADPLTGLHAAVAAYAHWIQGKGGLLDLSLCAVAQYCAERAEGWPADTQLTRESGAWWVTSGSKRFAVEPPRARHAIHPARELGADTQRIAKEWGLSC